MMKRFMITKSSVIEIQNHVMKYKSQSVKSNSVDQFETLQYANFFREELTLSFKVAVTDI